MNITIYQGHYPPPNPDGITVVIDVIRAFTTTHFAFVGGVTQILPVATAEQAFALRQQFPRALLAGEVDALPIEGFDFGNSPWEVDNADLAGRTLIMRTTNGMKATLNARPCAGLFVTGLISAPATAEMIRARNPRHVLLVASHPTGDEDMACAEYLSLLLGGAGISRDQARTRTRQARSAVKFLNGSNPRLRAADIDMAARCEPTGFAMEVTGEAPIAIHAVPLVQGKESTPGVL
ncbi:2-phosphosulfolactate phosphatase [Alcanivorax sp. JB21]|uniref:2-phosphosulfolactate phosphatase n=1 Tax=Alcanivorax limicola TaxID=2874102 RepID=UPI001CBDC3A9|nr:2-phosphosulfolactate phosphatase [Alcanivorax limicola]MBZ2189313.1 2-phosphosulfolactate phosphatase [Alcanivorax limicola]